MVEGADIGNVGSRQRLKMGRQVGAMMERSRQWVGLKELGSLCYNAGTLF